MSSDEQADEGRAGLPRQIEHCHEVARQKGYKMAWDMVFADDASGFEFEDRPALTRLRREFKSRASRANAVVMEHLDRLSRNADWHQGFLLHEMKEHSVSAEFWKPFGSRVERAVMGAVSQEGMEDAKARMKDGNQRKAERGRITARMHAHGLKFVDPDGNTHTMEARLETCYAIDENKALAVRFIFDSLAYRQVSLREVANELDWRAQIDPRYAPPRSKLWCTKQIRNLLRNPVYKGEYIANRFYFQKVVTYTGNGEIKKVRRTFKRPESEWVRICDPAIVPPLVDAGTWELANQRLKRNWAEQSGKKHEYLLSGLIRCACCGYRYRGNARKNMQRYYVCSTISFTPARRRAKSCTQRSIRCDTMDSAVWYVISEALLDPDRMARAIEECYSGEDAREKQEQIAYIQRQIED